MTNKTLVYKKIPTEYPVPGEHLAIEDRPFDSTPPPAGFTAKVLYASFDPYLRGKMRDPSIKSYSPAFEVDAPVTNSVVARVLESSVDGFRKDELLVGVLPIAEYVRVEDPSKVWMLRKISNPHNLDLANFLGAAGMPGLTAWSGLHKIGKPQKGETLFVSSAAGAVGQIVGQIARREGLTVIGSVGSDEKLEFITKELGFDAGFNYKKESPSDALKRLAPKGIDIYFDNVGAEHLEAALEHMNKDGRVPVCGMIAEYNQKPENRKGIKGLMALVAKTIAMEGFLVGKQGFGDVYYDEHQKSIQDWLADGSVKAKLDVTEGIENAAEGLVGMLKGENFGKAVLKV